MRIHCFKLTKFLVRVPTASLEAVSRKRPRGSAIVHFPDIDFAPEPGHLSMTVRLFPESIFGVRPNSRNGKFHSPHGTFAAQRSIPPN